MTDAHYDHALALFGQGRHAEGVYVLAQAAQAGHVSSMSLLGAQLLSGRGVAPAKGDGVWKITRVVVTGAGARTVDHPQPSSRPAVCGSARESCARRCPGPECIAGHGSDALGFGGASEGR